jgi:glycosyltransferase involved in cell wall biosynthesis
MSSAASNRTWLSVIIPSHRGEYWIDHALRSVAAEAAEGVEVLLVDSGDTSAARDIALSYSDKLRIRIVTRPDLVSWTAKTNFGVEIAGSDHIAWLGVDDVWIPGRAAAAQRWIAGAVEAPLHLAPAAIIDKYGRTLGIWRCPLPAECQIQSSILLERLCVQNFIAAPSPVIRRDAWLSCGGLDENLWYTADWDLWLKLAASAPAYYHDDVTIGFRIHAAALTTTGSRDAAAFRLQMETVLHRHLARIGPTAKRVGRVARASSNVNAALAAASLGNLGELLAAATQVALLGPAGIKQYFRDSRLTERLIPRLRAKIGGSF